MFKFLISKKKLVIGYVSSILISLIIIHISFMSSLNDLSISKMSSIESLQEIISQIHEEDSNLYQILLSKDNILSENIINKTKNTVISNLINLKSTELFSSQKLASTIDDYYSITYSRNQIIEIYKQGGSTEALVKLLEAYEDNVNVILENVEKEIKYISQSRGKYLKHLLNWYIISQILLLVSFLYLYFFKSSNKSSIINAKENTQPKLTASVDIDTILDSDCRKILEFIELETSKGSFPTFKDLKSHLGLSHPTILSKISNLEKKKLIGIRKQGRNKHLFLK